MSTQNNTLEIHQWTNGSSAATSGGGSSAATSGHRSSAATSGDGSSAATSGDGSSAATSGGGSSAGAVGECVTVESTGKGSICSAVASRLYWKFNRISVLFVRWQDPVNQELFPHAVFDGSTMNHKDGEMLKIEFGKIVSEFTF